MINIGIQLGVQNADQPHYIPYPYLSIPLVFSGWIQSLEASKVYFMIAVILSIEHPPGGATGLFILHTSNPYATPPPPSRRNGRRKKLPAERNFNTSRKFTIPLVIIIPKNMGQRRKKLLHANEVKEC